MCGVRDRINTLFIRMVHESDSFKQDLKCYKFGLQLPQ